MTSPVFFDITEHNWSSDTSEKQEEKDRCKGGIKKRAELALSMFEVLYKH